MFLVETLCESARCPVLFLNKTSMRQTCDGFDDAVRNLRDLLIYRNTQHLNGDPVQGSVINHSVLQSQSSMQYAVFYLQQYFLVIIKKYIYLKQKKFF